MARFGELATRHTVLLGSVRTTGLSVHDTDVDELKLKCPEVSEPLRTTHQKFLTGKLHTLQRERACAFFRCTARNESKLTNAEVCETPLVRHRQATVFAVILYLGEILRVLAKTALPGS